MADARWYFCQWCDHIEPIAEDQDGLVIGLLAKTVDGQIIGGPQNLCDAAAKLRVHFRSAHPDEFRQFLEQEGMVDFDGPDSTEGNTGTA